MRRFNHWLIKFLILALVVMIFYSGVFVSANSIRAEGLRLAQSPQQEAYLELSIDPEQSRAGSLVTLNITYHNIGLPYTTIFIDQPDLVKFDPPLTMPCKFHEHPNGCQAITLRTLKPGVVKFTASAHGEIWSDQCQCWYFTTVTDNGSATAMITEPMRFFIMYVTK